MCSWEGNSGWGFGGDGTCVAIAGEIDSDLATYAAGRADDEGYGLWRCHADGGRGSGIR